MTGTIGLLENGWNSYARMHHEAGKAPHQMGRAKQRRRKLEHGNALRRQAVVVGRVGCPQVERQRVP